MATEIYVPVGQVADGDASDQEAHVDGDLVYVNPPAIRAHQVKLGRQMTLLSSLSSIRQFMQTNEEQLEFKYQLIIKQVPLLKKKVSRLSGKGATMRGTFVLF